jgi:Flp pilus assembly protein TadD
MRSALVGVCAAALLHAAGGQLDPDAVDETWNAAGDHETAIGHFRRAVETDPSMVLAWNNMGLSLMRKAESAGMNAHGEIHAN